MSSTEQHPKTEISTDVVVIGYGAAGASAAIAARSTGAQVLILETAGGPGGSTALSGGLLYLGGGTALQKACGVRDTVEDMAAFLTEACGPGTDAAKIDAYCRDSPAHFDWLIDCGVPFKPVIWDRPTSEPWSDAGLMFSGGENAEPFASIAHPAPRGHCPVSNGTSHEGVGGGQVLMDHLSAHAEGLGVETIFGASVKDLIVEDGEVRGVEAVRYGRTLRVTARGGVVLTAGGFTFDDDLVKQHAPAISGTDPLGVDSHDGTLLRSALELGAQHRDLDAFEAALGVPPAILARSILVDRFARRFINEDAYMGRLGIKTLRDHDGWGAVVFDEAAFEAAPDLRRDFLPTHTGETVQELADELGLDAEDLAATIESYNRGAADGKDPEHGKRSDHLHPLQAPFGAVKTEGRFRTFTLGGLATDVDGAVEAASGGTIPGLFAAGRMTSGIAVGGYVSGMSIGDSTYFGRRAGESAAGGAR